jgi:uncharacterized membrane protein YfbV (UPF0208 family)
MLHIAPHPPDFVSIPWYTLIVRIENPGVFVTTTILQAAIASQLGVTFAGANVGVRLQSVRVWGALASGTTPLQPVSVVIFDPIFAGQLTNRVLEQITDYPDQVTRACIGYKYPKAQREVNFSITNVTPLNLLAANGLGNNSVVYFKVQWRPNLSTPTTTWLTKALRTQPLFSDDDDDEIEVISNKLSKSRLNSRN